MSDEKKDKKRYATIEDVGQIVGEVVSEVVEEKYKKIVGTKQVPDGYTKCAGCGMLIPLDKKDDCPYCEKPEPEKKDDDDDKPVGILGILADDDED